MTRWNSERLLCLWCGQLFKRDGDRASSAAYCKRTHRVKANYQRRIRRAWEWEGCDAPHAPAEADRGMAVAYIREHGGELLVCKCGKYHAVEAGEGGRSLELGPPIDPEDTTETGTGS